jgi:AH receptor-interacting protein
MEENNQKPIQKKILSAGRGPVELDFPNGTKVNFHFVTKKRNEDGTILDDSRKWEKPMELIIGKKFKLEAWEMCLQTMRMGELASFVVKRSYACDYPTVAKTLRYA